MRKLLIFLFLFIFVYSNAQIAFQNLAVRKPMQIDSFTFKYTGALQQFIVPNKVTSIKVQAIGAKGGTGGYGQLGGGGANIITTINVTPGQVLYIVVGGFPGQSSTAKYGFAGNGGNANNASAFGGAGGGLSGVFTSDNPAVANALVVAGGGGGGAGHGTGADYTGGNAGNTSAGNSSNGNEPSNAQTSYIKNGRYQYGYAATNSAAGIESYAFDNYPYNDGASGSDINGGNGGAGTIWAGGGGGGAGYYGGGGGAGGGDANGGGAGGATKTTSGNSSFGTANTTGDGSVTITCFSNSGLVLNLDAGNSSSYSGSGSTWNDLSGNGSNVTLTNTTYSSANGGSIVFNNSSNSYAYFNANIGSTNVVTVEMWVKTISQTGGMYFGFSAYDAWTNGGNLGYNTSTGDLYGISSTQFDYLSIMGNWRHLVFVMYAGDKTNNKIYVNGESQYLTQQANSFSGTYAVFNSGYGKISGWGYSGQPTNFLMNMQVASFKVYNRELSQQEIRNNFNSESSRFYAEKDGLSPNTASTSAYQIKLDYPNSTDGFYWIKNANINGGKPVKIYADMTTTDGVFAGGWTLIMKNSSNSVWTYANAIAYDTLIPYTSNTDITITSTPNYSIIKWADYIKKSSSGFQYMIDANTRGSYGGIWTANGAYTFTKGDNTQTDVSINKYFGSWNYVTNNNGIQKVMPWYSSTAGGGYALLTLTGPTGNWWGTLISAAGGGYSPAPWISDAGGGTSAIYNPQIIWYWVR